jgi:hypothetical protein
VAGVSLNDVVTDWGWPRGARDYNAAKNLVLNGDTQDEFAARFPTLSYNEALRLAALTFQTDNISLGLDRIVLGLDNVVLTY